MDNNINFFQGDSFDATIPVINSVTGASVDISLYTAALTVKKKIKDTAITLTKPLAIVNNKIVLALSGVETNLPAMTYVYNIVITKDLDVKTVVQATMKVKDSASV